MVEADTKTTTFNPMTAFPVVLYDGEREITVGNIQIHPDLVFKSFQTKLTEMTGISYNNLTTYLVDSTKPKTSPERRKVLITGKVNFAAVVRETNCYFFVVLKRSRRDRRRKPNKPSDIVSPDDLSQISLNRHRLNSLNDARMSAYSSYYYDDRFHDLLMNGESYVNMILNSRLDTNFPTIEDAYPRVQSKVNRSLCEDCTVALKQGKSPEFHLCVYDEVVTASFRSPAGPICRRR